MKRKTKSLAIPSGYLDAWARLFARSPAELDAEREARQPSPAPRTPNAQQGHLQAPGRTQTTGALPVPRLPKGKQS